MQCDGVGGLSTNILVVFLLKQTNLRFLQLYLHYIHLK